MIPITIAITVYVLSVLKMCLFIRTAHSRGGIWGGLHPDIMDVFMTFMPVMNTLGSVLYLFESGKLVKERKLDSFFNVKK